MPRRHERGGCAALDGLQAAANQQEALPILAVMAILAILAIS
jgi:hypothetical protein